MSITNNYPQNLFAESTESAVLICAFSGWNDAGNAAVDVIDYLNRAHLAHPIPGFNLSTYYNFTQTRPLLSHVAGTPVIEWPSLSVHQLEISGRTVLTLTAEEPHLHWQQFIKELFSFAQNHRVKHLVLLGALLGENPHTRPFPLSVSSYSEFLQKQGIEGQTYSGPTGITGVIAASAAAAGFTDLSLWVEVPHYAGHAPQPKASYELLRCLDLALGIATDLRVLEEEKEAWERGAEELLQEEPELAQYVRSLENRTQEEDITGDDIAAAFEQFLKGRDS